MRSEVYRPSPPFARVSLALVACSLVACTKALPSDGATPSAGRIEPAAPVAAPVAALVAAPALLPGPTEPAPPAVPEVKSGHVVMGDGVSGLDESAEVDWQESPLEADLDGDGVPEAIQWSCGPSPQTLRISVGRAKTRVKYRVSELIGCVAALVALRPDGSTRQLVFTIDEHDEVGPDLHFIYAYRGSRLERVWSGAASVDFLVDGTWVTETSDCDEASGYSTTTTSRHRWSGAKVATVIQKERTPVEPGGCDEP
jgi:hypothetical protein